MPIRIYFQVPAVPVCTSPALLKLPIMSPLGVTTLSTNVNAAGMAPSTKQFLPITECQRMNDEPQFVDQIMSEQQLDKRTTAPNLKAGAV